MLNSSQTNVTAGGNYQGLLERAMFAALISLPYCVFLIVNGIMLFSLRSKAIFCETPRYILLYNLLFADTLQMSMSQLLYILAVSRTLLTYPVCGCLIMLISLINDISPCTLVAMCLERYVAVCYPLRHAVIITSRNTQAAIGVLWAFSLLNVLILVIFLVRFSFEDLNSLQMNDYCATHAVMLDPLIAQYNMAYTSVLYLLSALAIICSYIGVVIAARSASTDKASAQKARNTLLLHLVQLGLILCGTPANTLVMAIPNTVPRIVVVRLYNVLYVCLCLFPRCLSTLIYGIKDQTIRPVLVFYLCCRLKLSAIPAKAVCSVEPHPQTDAQSNSPTQTDSQSNPHPQTDAQSNPTTQTDSQSNPMTQTDAQSNPHP